MKITANRREGKLIVGDTILFPISNLVRTLKDGTRKSSEEIRLIPFDLPSTQCRFLLGIGA